VSTLNYYYLSYLPSIDRLGQPVEIDCSELLQLLTSGGVLTRAGKICRAIILSGDLMLRESIIAGQIDEAAPSTLTQKQVSGEEPLPEYIVGQDNRDKSGALLTDTVWAGYFTFAAQTASGTRSRFLQNWVRYEVSLRNAIAAKRAEILGLEASDYIVASELGGLDMSSEVSRWSEAKSKNPLEEQKALDLARWEWLEQNGRYFSFSDDEIASYSARLAVSGRWAKLELGNRKAKAGLEL